MQFQDKLFSLRKRQGTKTPGAVAHRPPLPAFLHLRLICLIPQSLLF